MGKFFSWFWAKSLFHGRVKESRARFIKLVLISTVAIILGWSGDLAIAQQDDETIAVQKLMVTATRTERPLEELPMSVSVIGDEELRRNPQLDIGSQLWDIPGVMIHGQTGVGAARRVMIRGMSAARTMILVNGVRQPQLTGIDGSFYYVDPSNIERIEVIKGPASVLYGPEAIGGVVNIITKTAQGQDNDKPVGAFIGGIFDGSTEAFEPKAAIFGRYKGFSYRLSGSGVNAKDRRIPHDRVWHSSFTNRNYNGNLAYDWGGGMVSFMFEENKATHETILTRTRPSDGIIVPAKPWEVTSATVGVTPKQDRVSYTGRFELRDLTNYLAKISVTGFYQKTKRINGSDATINSSTHNPGSKTARTHAEHESVGGSIQSEWVFGPNNLILGFDFDKADMISQAYSFNRAGVRTTGARQGGFQKMMAIFGQDEIKAGDFTFTLGLRENWFEIELQEYSANPRMLDSSEEKKLVGNVGVVWNGISNLYLRALYSQGYRNPNLTMKFMGSGVLLANPDLKPETSENYELGVRYDNGAFRADLALFYNDLTNGFSMQNVPNTGNYQYINYSKAVNSGVELELEYNFRDIGLTPYGSLTLLNYRTEDPRTGFKTNHNGHPSRWGKLGVKYQGNVTDSTLLFADLNAVMSGGAHAESMSTNGVRSSSNFRKAFQTANLSFGFEGTAADVKYNTSISLRNIFNQYYTPITASPMPEPGFHVIVGFGLEY
ncbi:MAG: TonB-dependent receptor [Deltaproteobacteria bacterium]|jgi:hemoglobin/transferrin/lactoferrin receptor protein|nr:TonB-dependent receptor [Deltaproteobacteria bacterium]